MLPGESVTWQAERDDPSHNVHFDGEVAPVGAPSTSFSGTRQFPAAGTFRYRCDVHALDDRHRLRQRHRHRADAHADRVADRVADGGPDAPPGGGGGAPAAPPGRPGGGTRGVSSFRARAARGRFCTRRSARCRTPRRLPAARPRRVASPCACAGRCGAGREARARRVAARPARRAAACGCPGGRLKPGRYALTLRAGDITRVVRFRVRAS